MTDRLFLARIDDMLFRAERGEAVYSNFLNESERAEANAYLKGRATDCICRFYGGYGDAERTRLFIYPDYYEFCDISECISAVEIRGSGYETLKHSSFLGALTSLGIDRAKMGDIVLKEESGILFADEGIVKFLLTDPSPLTRVARDRVRLYSYKVPYGFCNDRQFKEIFDTVASARLDAVVSSLAGISREKAKTLCTAGSVQLNYMVEMRPDTEVRESDIITVRSVGKYVITSLAEKTKKDRYKLTAKKYI